MQELEIREDMRLQTRVWTLQRVAWILIAILLIAGGSGFFGDGGFAEAEIHQGSFFLHYERITRLGKPGRIVLTSSSGKIPDAAPDVRFLYWADISNIYHRAGAWVLYYLPSRSGLHKWTLRTEEGEIQLSTMVLP